MTHQRSLAPFSTPQFGPAQRQNGLGTKRRLSDMAKPGYPLIVAEESPRDHVVTPPTCTTNIFPAAEQMPPAGPASPRQFFSDPRLPRPRRAPTDSPPAPQLPPA